MQKNKTKMAIYFTYFKQARQLNLKNGNLAISAPPISNNKKC
jgi:hypothetical protein